jgi:aminoglycoside 6'-N-acetyltransferase
MSIGEVLLRPLTRADFPLLVGWLAQPHVAEWWGPPLDADAVEREYGPSLDGTDPTRLCICTEGDAPIGFLQLYRLSDNPDYVQAVGNADAGGIDFLIGDVTRVGQGIGPVMIAAGCRLLWQLFPEVSAALSGPSVRNMRSRRALVKSGFQPLHQVSVPGEADDEFLYRLPRPTAA